MAPVPLSARLLLLLFPVAIAAATAAALGEPATGSVCDPGVGISGGTVSLSQGGTVGSVLSYECPPGHYPYPTGGRSCLSTGDWSPMRDSRRQLVSNATCREFRCSAPSLEQGIVSPRRAHHGPGDTVSFVCQDGYRLLGPATRTCMSNGRWNGNTAVCDDGADTCPNPGTPPGSVKTGHNYGVGDKVRYRCLGQLALIGSALRVCQETGEWTGSEPSCQHKSSLDLPEEVALHFSSSFSHVLGETKVNEKEMEMEEGGPGRAIHVRFDQKLHIYLLLDVSGSVSEPDFQRSKDALSKFINMISRFEVSARYDVLLFASQTKVIVHISGDFADSPQDVAKRVSGLKYSDNVGKGAKGTNITGALQTVFWHMSYFRSSMVDKRSEWDEIRHVIIIFTDGKANVGGSPANMMKQISSFLEIDNSRDSYLDVYVFGIGTEVDKEVINSMASKKTHERHVFFLSNEDIHTVFNSMLDLSTVGNLCGFANKSLNASDRSSYPWFVEIVNSRKPDGHCSGSLVSPEWILTAAHCFDMQATADLSGFKVGLGGEENKLVGVERLEVHPLYDLRAKKGNKIPEFYDYDVALIKLATRLNFTTNIRPICLPCTVETSVALRNRTSCSAHETVLLLSKRLVQAKFVRRENGERKLELVKIKTGDTEREECIEHALHADIYANVSVVGDVVTDRFLCTGGNDEKVSCKGDSGGPLYVKEVYRNIQVGVVSWGVKDVCGRSRTDDHARDFHLNLFRVLDWLREHLGGSVHFL